MDIDSIIKALTKDALYTYEFDVTTGIAEKDIIDRQGVNYRSTWAESALFI